VRSAPRSGLLALLAVPLALATLLVLPGGASAAPVAAIRSTSPTPAAPLLGVYRGAGEWGAARIPTYEAFLGRRVDLVADYQATDTWSNQEWPDWQASAWRGRRVVLGAVGIFPGSWDRQFEGTTVGWQQAAAGAYDAQWRVLGERLVATGQASAILRGAHEFNGGWFPHRVENGEEGDFVRSWRRWVTILRSIPGQHFTFDWNPTLGDQALAHPEKAYPGDAYVDRVALDVYDGWYDRGWLPGKSAAPSTAERDRVWAKILSGSYGLRYWHSFARTHGKHMSLPEWGLRNWTEADGAIHGGGDNPVFIQRMKALISDPSWQIDYSAFWEDGSYGVSVGDVGTGRLVPVPKSRGAFLSSFKASRTQVARWRRHAS
jgi:hypothetical protein